MIAAGASPDVRDGKIVYVAGGDISLKDGAAAPVNLTSDAATQRNPKISGTIVAWQHAVSASDVDIVGHDFRTGTVEPLASGAGIQELHDLDGTNLAFTERSADAEGDIDLVREPAAVVVPADVALDPRTINLNSKGAYVRFASNLPRDETPPP